MKNVSGFMSFFDFQNPVQDHFNINKSLCSTNKQRVTPVFRMIMDQHSVRTILRSYDTLVVTPNEYWTTKKLQFLWHFCPLGKEICRKILLLPISDSVHKDSFEYCMLWIELFSCSLRLDDLIYFQRKSMYDHSYMYKWGSQFHFELSFT